MSDEKSHRRFWLSFATLCAVLAVFGIWLGVQVKWIRDRREALDWLWQNGNYGFNDGQKIVIVGAGGIRVRPLGQPTKAPWGLRPLFEPGVAAITVIETADENADAAKVQELSRLFPEAQVVRLSNGGATKPLHCEQDLKTGIVRRWYEK